MYADKKMYGFWTRKTESWIPDKLLCKRFNIPVPKQYVIYFYTKHSMCHKTKLYSLNIYSSGSQTFTAKAPVLCTHYQFLIYSCTKKKKV